MDPLPRPGTIVYDLIHGTIKEQDKAIKKFRNFIKVHIVDEIWIERGITVEHTNPIS